jgi:hypothetical protein
VGEGRTEFAGQLSAAALFPCALETVFPCALEGRLACDWLLAEGKDLWPLGKGDRLGVEGEEEEEEEEEEEKSYTLTVMRTLTQYAPHAGSQRPDRRNQRKSAGN